MPPYDNDDVFSSSSHSGSSQFLSASVRRAPSKQSINPRRSTASLRASSSLGHAIDSAGDDGANGSRQHSLAHELAAALMPEPSAGSKLLAEEFGIEYDEGAEGIDDDNTIHSPEHPVNISAPHILVEAADSPFVDEETADSSFHDDDTTNSHQDLDESVFSSPSVASRKKYKPEQDAMEILSQDLESTDKFLSHLRRIDIVDATSSITSQPGLEKIASDIIRRINESTRDREGQLRELLEYEREFRKIAGEVGGNDVLGQLDELTQVEDLVDSKSPVSATATAPALRTLDLLEEEPHPLAPTDDWEVDPHRLGDDDDDGSDFGGSELQSPIKDSFPAPPPLTGPPTPSTTIPHLADLRSFTTSLVSSLTTISEQAQVNGAATTEAGRKIRALKNKMGGWQTDWDSAERSRVRIERWEAGIIDGSDSVDSPIRLGGGKRVDGRAVVQEHLQAFERALAEAAVKTQAIMAS